MQAPRELLAVAHTSEVPADLIHLVACVCPSMSKSLRCDAMSVKLAQSIIHPSIHRGGPKGGRQHLTQDTYLGMHLMTPFCNSYNTIQYERGPRQQNMIMFAHFLSRLTQLHCGRSGLLVYLRYSSWVGGGGATAYRFGSLTSDMSHRRPTATRVVFCSHQKVQG